MSECRKAEYLRKRRFLAVVLDWGYIAICLRLKSLFFTKITMFYDCRNNIILQILHQRVDQPIIESKKKTVLFACKEQNALEKE